jgi:hypothetical protein
MNLKPDTFKRAILLQSGINISKYFYSFLIIPILIFNLKDLYAKYLYIISIFNIIFLFDFNLQNYGINLLYNSKFTLIKTKFFLYYLILFLPIILFVSIILLYFKFNFNVDWWIYIILFYFFLNFLSAQLGSLISTLHGFYYTNLFSFFYNFGLIITLFIFKPYNIYVFVTINFFWSFLLLIFNWLILKKNIENLKYKFKFRIKSFKKLYYLLITTKEYTFQRIVEYINTNYLPLLIIPINPSAGLLLIIFKTVFSVSIFITNFFIYIYQQLYLNKGNHILINRIFFLINIFSLSIFSFILLFFSKYFIKIVSDYFNLQISIISINFLWLILLHTVLININKQFNIKRNVKNLNKQNLVYPVILHVLMFCTFFTFSNFFNIQIILISFIISEFYYFLIQYKK